MMSSRSRELPTSRRKCSNMLAGFKHVFPERTAIRTTAFLISAISALKLMALCIMRFLLG
jgi:hypothetical protein